MFEEPGMPGGMPATMTSWSPISASRGRLGNLIELPDHVIRVLHLGDAVCLDAPR